MAPQAPEVQFTSTETTVTLTWDIPGDTPDDVQVWRRTTLLAELPPEDEIYPDDGPLQPGTLYNYAVCCVYGSGSLCTEVDARTQGAPPPPSGSAGGGGGGGADVVETAVKNLVATPKPFGRIAVSWVKTGDFALQLLVRRIDAQSGIQTTVLSTKNYNNDQDFDSDGLIDNGPFTLEATYFYGAWTYENYGNPAYIFSPSVVYPSEFGLRSYLPAGFDASIGIKGLWPGQETGSVRAFMSAS
jgi:hypothetical protein